MLFRTFHLFFIKDVQTGSVWATKILTDPFHDIKIYHKAPLALLRGELIDPGIGLHHWDEEDAEEAAADELIAFDAAGRNAFAARAGKTAGA